MNLGENLRRLIEINGITQKELANRMNIAPSTMGCYVQNTREPDYETLKKLADYFGVSTDFLLGHLTTPTNTQLETYLLHIFRAMNDEQQKIYLAQGEAFIRNANE